ncbi:MAG: phosphoenolpyruvate--protein phosphotransferase [Kiritimatiellae bacterium]|nr:phosphoenolpyruvate--protein phosphotransferase [Kiritimatiellia bacterium]
MSRWKKDNVELICSVAELGALFERSRRLEDFLATIVSTVAYHMRAAVCSIYLYDEDRGDLVLAANQGLRPGSVGRVRLALGEGITGLAVKEYRPICEGRGSRNPNFKAVPDIDEEKFEAFLAVPILRGLTRVGALVVQDPQPDYFDDNDARALRAIAAQLATAIENAKLLLEARGAAAPVPVPRPETGMLFLKGQPAAVGIARGRLLFLDQPVPPPAEDAPARTLDDFRRALRQTESQLEHLQQQMEQRLEDVASLIFSAHLLILKDDAFSGEMDRAIAGGMAPAAAVQAVLDRYVALFEKSRNPQLREKVQDIRDLGHRLLQNLLGADEAEADYAGCILVADELLPSGMLKLVAQKVAGLVLRKGGVTAHVAVLARSLGVPLVLLGAERLGRVPGGTEALLDAHQGTLFVRPNTEVLRQYEALRVTAAAGAPPDLTLETAAASGERFRVMANMNLLSDLLLVREMKAEGVGLYRTEFPFIVRHDFPSEEEQHRIYSRVLDELAGQEVVFRTLDIGGDKMLSYYPTPGEANPFLGLRAIRFSLRNQAVFSQQIRALLRAGAGRGLSILFPLIASLDEWLAVREIVRACAADLAREGTEHEPAPRLGIMIEVPAAVEIAEELSAHADFLSIGTNDLIQYLLAVDRTNESIADLYQGHHPAVLRALHRVAQAAARQGKSVSVCGDMAADGRMIPFLAGIGIRTLSVNPRSRPAVQRVVKNLDLRRAEELSRRMLRAGSLREVEALLASPA